MPSVVENMRYKRDLTDEDRRLFHKRLLELEENEAVGQDLRYMVFGLYGGAKAKIQTVEGLDNFVDSLKEALDQMEEPSDALVEAVDAALQEIKDNPNARISPEAVRSGGTGRVLG